MYNGVATKAPPITTMTLLATTFFVLKSTSFYKSTLNNKLILKTKHIYLIKRLHQRRGRFELLVIWQDV